MGEWGQEPTELRKHQGLKSRPYQSLLGSLGQAGFPHCSRVMKRQLLRVMRLRQTGVWRPLAMAQGKHEGLADPSYWLKPITSISGPLLHSRYPRMNPRSASWALGLLLTLPGWCFGQRVSQCSCFTKAWLWGPLPSLRPAGSHHYPGSQEVPHSSPSPLCLEAPRKTSQRQS